MSVSWSARSGKDSSITTRLDKLEHPGIPSFRDQFPTKDAILGQVHVALLERGILTRKMLSLEIARQRSVAELVILFAKVVSVLSSCATSLEKSHLQRDVAVCSMRHRISRE